MDSNYKPSFDVLSAVGFTFLEDYLKNSKSSDSEYSFNLNVFGVDYNFFCKKENGKWNVNPVEVN